MPGENELRAPNTITHNSVTEVSVSGEYLSDPQGLEALAYNANAVRTNSHQGTVRERIKRIIEETGKSHGVTYNEIMSDCRVRKLSSARQEAMVAVGSAFPHLSFPQLGRIFKRDHSTVQHAFNKLGVPPRSKSYQNYKQFAEAQQQVAVGSINSEEKEVPHETA